MTSFGVWNFNRFRGRSLSSTATVSRCSSLNPASSVPFGKYCRSSPLVFSRRARAAMASRTQSVSTPREEVLAHAALTPYGDRYPIVV